MSVYVRGRVWWCDFQIAGEQIRRSLKVPSTKSRAAAERAERALRAAIENDVARRGRKAFTLSEACTLWLEEKGVRLNEPADEQRAALVRLCALFEGDPPIASIDAAAVTAALNRRRGQTFGKARKRVSESRVIRDVLATLRRVLYHARDTHGAAIVSIKWGKLVTPPPKRGKGRELRASEVEAFWNEGVREDWRDFIEFVNLACVRRGQAIGMRWGEDWDPHARSVRVRVQKKRLGAAVEHRWLPVGERAAALVEAQRGRHPIEIWTYAVHAWRFDPATGKHVMAPTGARAPVTVSALKNQWRRRRRQRAAPGFRVHDLRHDGLSKMVRATRSLELARDRAGHASIVTTSDFYAHVLDGDRRYAADALEAVASRPRENETPHKTPHNPAGAERETG